MNLIKFSVITSLFLFVLLSPNTKALGKDGHQLVCQLAFNQLSSANQTKIEQLISNVPKQHVKLINKYNYRSESTPLTFADSCTWADAIKRDDSFDKFKPWHYVNIERDQSTYNEDSCKKNCLPKAIEYHNNQLTLETNQWKKVQALMFLGHWVGDIHQPLHVSYFSDLGGNKTQINYEGRCTSLHWFWDDCLLSGNLKSHKEFLEKQTSQLKSSPVEQWRRSSITDWANESLTIVRTEAFKYCSMDNKGVCHKNKQPVSISQAYIDQFYPVIERRILQASVRLAGLLENSL